jgi:hypothetical protein
MRRGELPEHDATIVAMIDRGAEDATGPPVSAGAHHQQRTYLPRRYQGARSCYHRFITVSLGLRLFATYGLKMARLVWSCPKASSQPPCWAWV